MGSLRFLGSGLFLSILGPPSSSLSFCNQIILPQYFLAPSPHLNILILDVF